ncbi:hypothetical protein FKP32DRAFT_1346262 [Trametes sanguinea]|nr:hypothetical protein FKP32DRAFT_1346262 [Trametes sanguinea]
MTTSICPHCATSHGPHNKPHVLWQMSRPRAHLGEASGRDAGPRHRSNFTKGRRSADGEQDSGPAFAAVRRQISAVKASGSCKHAQQSSEISPPCVGAGRSCLLCLQSSTSAPG